MQPKTAAMMPGVFVGSCPAICYTMLAYTAHAKAVMSLLFSTALPCSKGVACNITLCPVYTWLSNIWLICCVALSCRDMMIKKLDDQDI